MSPQLRWASFAALAVAIVVAGVVTGLASATSSRIHTLRVLTVRPHTETLDFPPRGKSPGDLYVFDATVATANGRTVIGRLRGTQTDIKLERGMETVQGMLTYELGNSNEIVVGGLSANPVSPTGFLIRGKTFVRAVLGGTGRYTGARGTVTTTRLSSSRYLQVFRLTY